MNKKNHTFIALALCLYGTAATAQESDTQQILQLLQGMSSDIQDIKAEQQSLREDVDALKAEPAAPVTTQESSAPKTETPQNAPIKRDRGWIASIYQADRNGTQGGMYGRSIIDGFPMRHSKASEVDNSTSYKLINGTGEIHIKDEGTHNFTMLLSVANRENPRCGFDMSIGGQTIFNEQERPQTKSGTQRSWVAAVDLSQGYYTWEINLFCGNIQTKYYDNITWDLQLLPPNAMNRVSVGKNAIFHRAQ